MTTNHTYLVPISDEITESFYFRAVFSILLLVILCFSVSGGTFVCYVIKPHHLFKKRIWIYLFILALADITTAIFNIPIMLSASIDEKILSFRPICNLNGFTMNFGSLWSIYTLVAISVEKCVTISRPFQSLQRDGNAAVVIFAVIVTLLSLCLAGAPLIGFSRYTYLKCRKWCSTISPHPTPKDKLEDTVLSLCLALFGYIAPVGVIMYSSIKTYLMVKRQQSAHINMRSNPRTPPGVLLTAGNDALVKTVGLLISAFLFCWTPTFFLVVIGMAHIPIPLWYTHMVYVFILLQGNINPAIYSFRHAIFKVELRMIFCRTGKQPNQVANGYGENVHSKREGSCSTIWSNLPSPVPLTKIENLRVIASSTDNSPMVSPPWGVQNRKVVFRNDNLSGEEGGEEDRVKIPARFLQRRRTNHPDESFAT